MRTVIFPLAIIIMAISHNDIVSQELRLNYTNEFQTDFRGKFNWVNLFRMDYAHELGSSCELEVATISVAKTNDNIANDLQTFSNIEEDNLPLALAVLGIRYSKRNIQCFLGVRNVNEDYFNSPITSLFTNSSCGIFPTLSTNYPLANYPLSSLCVDFSWICKNWTFQSSVYNGIGYKRLYGRENIFRFCPLDDGILSISSVNYNSNGSNFYLGSAFHSRMPYCDEERAEKEAEKTQTKKNIAFWGYMEQKVSKDIFMMAHYSLNPGAVNGCQYYYGAGVALRTNGVECAFFTDFAKFKKDYEHASELTCRVPILKDAYIQPTLHLINSGSGYRAIGTMRFGIEF